jgi:hypothetical protein
MSTLIYKVFNLYHSKQCGTSHLTLATTIFPSSVSPLIHHAPPQAKVFLATYICTCTAVNMLNRTRFLTTFVRKTFDTRSRSNLSLNHRL